MKFDVAMMQFNLNILIVGLNISGIKGKTAALPTASKILKAHMHSAPQETTWFKLSVQTRRIEICILIPN